MQIVGILASTYILDKWGRKTTMVLGNVLTIIGAFILYLAPSYPVLLCGSVVCGLAMGILYSPGFLLLSEICLIRY